MRGLKFVSKVDNFDVCERTIFHTRRNGDEFVFSILRVMKSFERWSRGTQQRDGVFHFCPNDGNVAAVVARRFFLFVTIFLLFVDDDKAEFFERGENGGARADDDAGFAGSNAAPFAGALDIAESRVQNGDSFKSRAKPAVALAADPKRECNFGDEDNGGFAARKSILHGAKVNFGFAAASDATEQEDAKFAQFESRTNALQGVFLFEVKVVRGRRVANIERIFGGINIFFPAFEKTFAEHAVNEGARDLCKFQELGQWERAALGFKKDANALGFLADCCG
jgi:hypothetical protein